MIAKAARCAKCDSFAAVMEAAEKLTELCSIDLQLDLFYQLTINEPLPVEFTDLLAQMRPQDGSA